VDQFQVRAEFKRRLEKNEVSERHSESLSETLRKLETRFGEQLVSEIQTEDIREWLSGLPLATKTRNNPGDTPDKSSILPSITVTSRRIRLPRTRDSTNAAPKTTKSRFSPPTKPSNYFEQPIQRLFRLTLSFFCGVRVATLERLSWADVKFEERRVIVPRYKGKNQKRYPVTSSENTRGMA
jgi:integrase